MKGSKERGGQKYGPRGVKISPYFPSSGALKIYPNTNVNNIYKGLVETEVQKRGGSIGGGLRPPQPPVTMYTRAANGGS